MYGVYGVICYGVYGGSSDYGGSEFFFCVVFTGIILIFFINPRPKSNNFPKIVLDIQKRLDIETVKQF